MPVASRCGSAEWERLKRDPDALEEITVENAGRTFVIRTRGDAGKALQATGVALVPTVRLCNGVRCDRPARNDRWRHSPNAEAVMCNPLISKKLQFRGVGDGSEDGLDP